MIKIIVAYDAQRGIGKNGQLPWPHFSEDMKRFKELTNGQAIIMGRKTAESIGKPLPDRRNIVVTSDFDQSILLQDKGFEVYYDLDAAIDETNLNCWIIGGAQIYQQTIKFADELYITKIQNKYDCDVKFPVIDTKEWYEPSVDVRYSKELKCEYCFIYYKRR